jgi:hypothetical protein
MKCFAALELSSLACGSMVLYMFVCSFSPRRVKKNIPRAKPVLV